MAFDAPENDLQRTAPSSELAELPDLATSVALVRAAQRGHEEALGELFERYRERLTRIVRIELGPELARFVEPGDILAEAFVVARRRIVDFEPHSRPAILAWLVTIAKRKVKDARRKEHAARRDRARERPLDGGASPDGRTHAGYQLAAETAGPRTRAYQHELRDVLDDTLAELPPDYRRVILLRDYYGSGWDEVSVELERTRHACEELHRRAWIRLKLNVLRKLGPDA